MKKMAFFVILISVLAIIGVKGFMGSSDNSNQKVVILLGPPGSGKGTQAKKITQSFKVPHISTGDLFRENIGKNTELGQKAKGYIDSGNLVPDQLVLDMLFSRISQPDCKEGYILDGFPRTIPQAEALDSQLSKRVIRKVINLDVSDETVIKRISGRLSCASCGNIQNKYFSPPKEEGKCDNCEGKLSQRDDDKQEVVQERLKVYKKQTEPLIKYYNDQGVLITLNGDQNSPDELLERILSFIKN